MGEDIIMDAVKPDAKQTVFTLTPMKKRDKESIPITISSIEGALFVDETNTKATAYELTDLTIKGSIAVEDRYFNLPIRRDDGRLFLFLVQVVNGEFTATVNFPTVGQFTYSNNECNIDLPYEVFTVKTVKFDILRKIT